MEKSRTSITPLILLLTISAFGQGPVQKNKEIGISVFTLEANSETLNARIEPKFVFGAFYNQYFSNLSWISSVNYGNNTIDDDCPQCADMYYGQGHMTEFGISSGLRYTFLRKRGYFIKPLIEFDLCYSSINYRGEFGGGYDGNGINIDFRNDTFGILGRAGFCFQPISQISLTISSSLRSSTGKIINRLDDSNEKTTSNAATCIEIRLGYGF